MKITFLGTGNAFAPRRDWGCILVNDTLLLDAGPSLLVNLKRLSLDPARISHLFLTHFHGDHFFGLPFLLLEYRFLSKTNEPLVIVGPPGVEARVRAVMELAYPDIAFAEWPRPLRFVEGEAGVTLTAGGVTFTPVAMAHGGEEMCAFGYRIALPDGLLAYSGDTRMTEAVYTLIDGARVLILEAASEEESFVHLGRNALRTVLARAPKDGVAFLTHFDTPDADAWAELGATLPRDLETFQVDIPASGSPVVRAELETGAIEELQQQLRQRERELEAVVSITHALQTQVRLDELVQQAVLAAMSTVDADAGSLLLHDPEREKLIFRHVEGPTKDKVMGLEIADTQGIAGEVFHGGQARISHDVTTERAHILDIDRAANYQTRSMITVPLRASTGETIGVLQVLNKHTGLFDAEDLAVVEVLGGQIAAAVITAQLHERARAAVIVDLLGQITHDIKNLLTPVSMAGQTIRLMLDSFQEEMLACLAREDQDPRELLQLIEQMVRQVTASIEEVIAISEESTQIAQQRTKELADAVKGLTTPPIYELANINEVAQGVCRVLRVVAEQHGIALCQHLGDVPAIYHDARRMYNALYNLVNNALGATPNGGCVTVRTRVEPAGIFPDGHYVEVAVRDTGCGMPPDTAAQLFTGRVRSTKPGGTGLGTRVVKNVIDAHGGRLLVDSVEGQGTTIAARIPIRTEL